tara:strand:+ start:8089 stop:8481 length:393 start_codon:yes stop_codon:yes gene_type:complete
MTLRVLKERVIMLKNIGWFIFVLLFSSFASAGGWTTKAKPTRIDTVRAEGIMVYGKFGNPAGCTEARANQVFIKSNHPSFQNLYSTVLAAFASGKSIRIYAHTCEPVGWYTTSDTTYNTMTSSGSLNIFE